MEYTSRMIPNTARPDRFNPQPKKGRPEPKTPKPISRMSNKKKQEVKENKVKQADLDLWYLGQQKKMTGTCVNCGGRSEKYRTNAAHVLPKSLFPSIATHEENCIELCFYGKACHTNYDNKVRGYEIEEMNCFDLILQKFLLMYPAIAPDERGRLPESLTQYLEPK